MASPLLLLVAALFGSALCQEDDFTPPTLKVIEGADCGVTPVEGGIELDANYTALEYNGTEFCYRIRGPQSQILTTQLGCSDEESIVQDFVELNTIRESFPKRLNIAWTNAECVGDVYRFPGSDVNITVRPDKDDAEELKCEDGKCVEYRYLPSKFKGRLELNVCTALCPLVCRKRLTCPENTIPIDGECQTRRPSPDEFINNVGDCVQECINTFNTTQNTPDEPDTDPTDPDTDPADPDAPPKPNKWDKLKLIKNKLMLWKLFPFALMGDKPTCRSDRGWGMKHGRCTWMHKFSYFKYSKGGQKTYSWKNEYGSPEADW